MVLASVMDANSAHALTPVALTVDQVKAMNEYKGAAAECPGLALTQGQAGPIASASFNDGSKTCQMQAQPSSGQLLYDNCPGSLNPPPQ